MAGSFGSRTYFATYNRTQPAAPMYPAVSPSWANTTFTAAGERAKLRAKAHAWLTADLAARRPRATDPVQGNRGIVSSDLSHWLTDTDLAGVRPGLPRIGVPADECKAWDTFWADVRAVIDLANAPPAKKE